MSHGPEFSRNISRRTLIKAALALGVGKALDLNHLSAHTTSPDSLPQYPTTPDPLPPYRGERAASANEPLSSFMDQTAPRFGGRCDQGSIRPGVIIGEDVTFGVELMMITGSDHLEGMQSVKDPNVLDSENQILQLIKQVTEHFIGQQTQIILRTTPIQANKPFSAYPAFSYIADEVRTRFPVKKFDDSTNPVYPGRLYYIMGDLNRPHESFNWPIVAGGRNLGEQGAEGMLLSTFFRDPGYRVYAALMAIHEMVYHGLIAGPHNDIDQNSYGNTDTLANLQIPKAFTLRDVNQLCKPGTADNTGVIKRGVYRSHLPAVADTKSLSARR